MRVAAVCVASAALGSLLVVLREIAPTLDTTTIMAVTPFVLGVAYAIAISKSIKWLA